MRASLLAVLVYTASLAVQVRGVGLPSFGNLVRHAEKDIKDTKEDNNDAAKKTPVFNGQTVPQMTSLTDTSFNRTIQDGYWLVKYHSPYCPHCREFAPAYETLYEWYQTSKPTEPTRDDDLGTFEGYYDFHFGEIDCMAFGDTCSAHNIKRWPSFVIYKNAEFVEMYNGDVDVDPLARWMEKHLDTIKPGSRPKEYTLPKQGAKEGQSPLYTLVKEKEDSTSGEKTAQKPSEKRPAQQQKPHDPPVNEGGVSIALTPETYANSVAPAKDPWFVKYYAPWCSHCQALQPIWSELAQKMQGKLNIGEVNCDATPQICRDAGVIGFPTLDFHYGANRYSYEGMRGIDDLTRVANRAVDVIEAGVQHVSAKKFDQIAPKEEVIYLFVTDTDVPPDVQVVLEKLSLSVFEYATVLTTDSERLADRFEVTQFPRMISYKQGIVQSYEPGDLSQEKNVQALDDWMQSVKMPIVPDLTSSVAYNVLQNNITVLGILDEKHADQFAAGRHELSNAALEWIRGYKKLIAEHNGEHVPRRDRVQFAWITRSSFEQLYQSTYYVDLGINTERVVIIDNRDHRFWDTNVDGKAIAPEAKAILNTLETVITSPNNIPSHPTINIVFRVLIFMWRTFTAHPSFFACVAILSPLVTAQYLKTKLRRSGARYTTTSSARFGFFPYRGDKSDRTELPLTSIHRSPKVD